MLLRKIARPLLAVWFINDGADAVRHPGAHLGTARGPADQLAALLGRDPLTDRQLTAAIRAHGAITVAAAGCLATGRKPRSAALLLAALTVPLAIADQPFTSAADTRSARAERFAHRLGAIGAAVLAGIDTEGRPGVAWRLGQSKGTRAAAKAAAADA